VTTLESARLCPLVMAELGTLVMRVGEEWVMWVTEGEEKVAGTAETNLAVEGVKGAVAMTGFEKEASLGTGASVTMGSIVVASEDISTISISFSDTSLASTISAASSCTGAGTEGIADIAGVPEKAESAGIAGKADVADEGVARVNIRPSVVWKNCPG